eukprot:COSAG02_NODE_4237_length_5599_cov_6.352000_4_plen_86_part_00
MVPDPDSVRPSDWDDDEDGPWAPEMIKNPVCESQAKTVRASARANAHHESPVQHSTTPTSMRLWRCTCVSHTEEDLYAAAYVGRQ